MWYHNAQHRLPIHLSNAEVESVVMFEKRCATPDQIAILIIDMRSIPERKFILFQRGVRRKKPVSWCKCVFIVDLDIPPGSADVWSCYKVEVVITICIGVACNDRLYLMERYK